MDSVGAVKTAFGGAHMWFDGTVGDITATQANEQPPGCVHTIGYLMAHILHCEDGLLSMFVMGTPPIWEAEGLEARTGLPMIMDFPGETAPRTVCDPELLRDYGKRVFARTDECLANLTPAALAADVDLSGAGMGSMPLGQFLLTMLLGNTYAHTGEISALKGIGGAKGYPF
jgi:hypothetical protein